MTWQKNIEEADAEAREIMRDRAWAYRSAGFSDFDICSSTYFGDDARCADWDVTLDRGGDERVYIRVIADFDIFTGDVDAFVVEEERFLRRPVQYGSWWSWVPCGATDTSIPANEVAVVPLDGETIERRGVAA